MSASPVSLRLFAGIFIVTASFIPGRAKAQNEYREPRNAEVDARGARSVRIEAEGGSLRVEGHQGISQVRVRGTARTTWRNRLDDIKLVAERRGDVVLIKADIPDNDGGWRAFDNGFMGLDLVIEVPLSLRLDVEDGSGEAHFLNTGPITLDDGSGEIEIRGARGDVVIDDGSGEIVLDGVEGNVTIEDGSGEIRVRNVTGSVRLDDGSGGIDVSGVGGTVRVGNDGSGNIDVDRVGGDFVVDSDGGGSIRFDTVKGSVRIPERKRRS